MRLGLLLALAACSSSAAAGPRWPKPSAREADGGESVAPRPAARAIAALAEEARPDRDKPSAKPAEPAAVPAAPPARATPAPASDATATEDEPLSEELVIEIED